MIAAASNSKVADASPVGESRMCAVYWPGPALLSSSSSARVTCNPSDNEALRPVNEGCGSGSFAGTSYLRQPHGAVLVDRIERDPHGRAGSGAGVSVLVGDRRTNVPRPCE